MTQFIWPIRIYYEDTDAGGMVFYANYLKFMERARTELLRAKGFEQTDLRNKEQVLFVVRSVTIDYLKSAFFNDLLGVNTEIKQLKKASLVFSQTVSRDETVLCKAEVCVACVDSQSLRPKLIPDDLIAQFQ